MAVLRRADGLFELCVDDAGAAQLRELTEARSEPDRRLLAAWRSLAEVREPTREMLAAVRTVLTSSRIDPFGDEPRIEPLRIEPPPAPHVPTAANPRAYKGTKDRPPKPRRPESQDLRPHLCSFVAQDRLLAALARFLEVKVPPAVEELRDAPAAFRRLFAFALRKSPAAAGVLRNAWFGLSLDRDAVTAGLLAVLATRHGANGAASWCEALTECGVDERFAVLRIVLDAGAATAVGVDVRAFVASLRRCCGPRADARRKCVVERLRTGGDFDALLAGFELADERCPEALFFPEDEGSRSDADRLRSISGESIHGGDALEIWSNSKRRPGLVDLALAVAQRELAPAARRDLFDILAWELGEASSWPTQRLHLPAAIDAIAAAPAAWQQKAVDVIGRLLADANAALLPSLLQFAPQVINAVCAPPCAESTFVEIAVEPIACLHAFGHASLNDLPVACWHALDDACRRKNDAWRIAEGLWAIAGTSSAFLRAAWIEHPTALLRAAATLGLLSRPHAKSILDAIAGGPLWCDARELDAKELSEVFSQCGPKHGVQPFSRRLRRHLEGEEQLGEAALLRDTALVHAAWTAVVCDAIHEQCLLRGAKVAVGEGGERVFDDADLRHAVMLHADTSESRRALRRLLIAHVRGESKHREKHPTNVAWFRRHPRIAADAWATGPMVERSLADGRLVRIAFEQDPLAVLRLGTEVGSCFGLGGAHNHSAFAVAMDANKRVAFARDEKGRFVARQVVAITDDERLACFRVYPLTCARELQAAFAEWNRMLASSLGVSVVSAAEEEEPAIELLVAERWWQDDVWDGVVEGEASASGGNDADHVAE